MSKLSKTSIKSVACPYGDAGNDPEALVIIQNTFTTKALHSLMHIVHIVHIAQYGGYDLNWPWRSALFECFV